MVDRIICRWEGPPISRVLPAPGDDRAGRARRISPRDGNRHSRPPEGGRLGRVQLWNSAICTFLARIDPLGRLAAARYDVVILDRVWAPKTLSPLCDLGLFMD
jgi:hypothetical protein